MLLVRSSPLKRFVFECPAFRATGSPTVDSGSNRILSEVFRFEFQTEKSPPKELVASEALVCKKTR
jgi:hypothetical protein